MFDEYEPDLPCPACGAPTHNYQGKGGPCLLIKYKQGHTPEPTMDGAPPLLPEHAALPEVFHFSCGKCTMCEFEGIPGIGYATAGIWSRSELSTNGNTATRIDPECAVCDQCDYSILISPHMSGAFCPNCKRLVAIRSRPSAQQVAAADRSTARRN